MPLNDEYQKSPASGNGGCCQARRLPDGNIAFGDTKNPGVPPFIFTPEEWLAFLGGVRRTDVFDLD